MKTATDDHGIAAVVGYISQHACEGLGVDQVVKETQRVPKSVCIRRFRAITGQTQRTAILRRQLDEARRLLADTELSLVFIAEHCGFRNLKALERVLQAAEGQTATQFRQGSRPVGDGRRGSSRRSPQTRKARSA